MEQKSWKLLSEETAGWGLEGRTNECSMHPFIQKLGYLSKDLNNYSKFKHVLKNLNSF